MLMTPGTRSPMNAIATLPGPAIALLATLLTAVLLGAPDPWRIGSAITVAIILLAGLIWRHPILVAGAIPALLPPPQFLSVFAYEIGLLVVTATVLAAGVKGRRHWVWRLDRIELLAWAFVGWGLLSLMWGESFWWGIFAIRKYGLGAIALWTAWRLARMDLSGWDLFTGIGFGAISLSVATLLKALSMGVLTAGYSFSRRDGTDLGWGTSNYLGALLVMMLPSCLHLAMRAPQVWRRAVGWVAVPLSALVMAVAASRGGALLMVSVALVFLFRERVGRHTLFLALAIGSAIALMLLGPGSSMFISRFTSPREIGSIVVRLFLAREGLRRAADHFPFGMGLGQGVATADHLNLSSPHNFAITLAYETGVPGLLLFGAWVTAIWRRGWQKRHHPEHGHLAFALLFTLGTGVLNSLFEPTLEGLHGQFLFCWVLGVQLGTLSKPEKPDPKLPASTSSG
jgi:O-antigen ligase